MRVLFVQNIEGIAGSEKYFWQLLPALKLAKVEVEFLCVYKKEFTTISQTFAATLQEQNIPVHFIETGSYINPFLLFKIKKLIRLQKIDVLHTHLIYADFWSALLKSYFGLKIKTISTLHGYQEDIYTKFCLEPILVPKNRYYKIARFCYKRIDKVYACSFGLKNFFEAIGIETKQPIDVVHHGFDYPKLESVQSNPDNFICVIVGRLIPRKGHELILKHCKKLSAAIPNFKLVIVGDGPLKQNFIEQIRNQQCQNFVHFTGEVSNPRTYMNEADIVLVPSYAEGLPLVIFEAMSVAKPVIAFDTIGPAEVVQNNLTGYLISPFNDVLFCDKIIELSKDCSKISTLGINAKKIVEENFSLRKMTEETINVYQTVLK